MPIMTILVDQTPKYVVRPTDNNALRRFLRQAREFLAKGDDHATISHRPAESAEIDRWKAAFALHLAWGGEEEGFFGIPLF